MLGPLSKPHALRFWGILWESSCAIASEAAQIVKKPTQGPWRALPDSAAGRQFLVQLPATQWRMPLQGTLQCPQFRSSVAVLTQAPLQSEYPASQESPQVPPVQRAVECVGWGQTLSHTPQ
jgi:hypothetical protein